MELAYGAGDNRDNLVEVREGLDEEKGDGILINLRNVILLLFFLFFALLCLKGIGF